MERITTNDVDDKGNTLTYVRMERGQPETRSSRGATYENIIEDT